MPSKPSEGMIHLACSHSVDETVARLASSLRARDVHVFARIDHSQAAAEVGLNMRPTQLLLFGNPAMGTPMMIAARTLAIDLPSKALVWEDETGKVWLTYNAPEYLGNRHNLPESMIGSLNKLADVLSEAAK